MKGNKEVFYRYINRKRKTKENVSLLLNGNGDLVAKDTEKAKVLTACFTSAFTGKTACQQPQSHEARGEVWSKEYSFSEKEDQVTER